MIVILVESLISCFLFDVPPDLEYHQTRKQFFVAVFVPESRWLALKI